MTLPGIGLIARSALVLATGLLAFQAASAQPAKVRLGAFSSVSDAALYVAQEKGYFAEQNLDVEFVQINSGAVMTTELANGNLDASGGSPGAGMYNAVRQGIPMKIVADKGSSHPGHGYFAFVVRKDLADQIKRPADLRGRVLAVTGHRAGASSEVTIGRLLAQDGVKESEVKLINMTFGDIVAALGTGKIEAAVLIEPLVTQVVARDIAVMWKRVDEVYPSQQYGALMYGPGIIKRPDVANRFMVAYVKAARYYNDVLQGKIPKDELVAILTKHTSVKDRALYDRMKFPGIDPNGALNLEGMRYDVDWWVANGRMKEKVDLERIVDTSYSKAAVERLGPYK
jgi:NitT/TauT family transport system substrate-binding protein